MGRRSERGLVLIACALVGCADAGQPEAQAVDDIMVLDARVLPVGDNRCELE